ncbi:hypothetical protein TSOC_004299 [Tetrabaena socialis]|uniref:Uncharacterized protein n=1 Tax=Tetrabaena socialis TaxID=47790 RepID=A0A2J8A9A5_9CHLO|nr:hypothetical protein TSOC_004299 [Tetrabaena socialis]|eukprot:PNH09108.1 hypothetical protein TSOC_004299 [Tetrabaena socialis]
MSAKAAAAAPPPADSSTALIIVGVVVAIVAAILLQAYLQHRRMVANAPPRPRKKPGAKQLKREKLKQGLRPAGDD